MARALISVSDKTGVANLAARLAASEIKIISTGGTAVHLKENGIPVTAVAEVTGFPEIMDGRVKTLHPSIHGAILGLREEGEHRKQAQKHGIEWIDWVIVNLYPFRDTVSRQDVILAEAVEQIDIGGPSMIRSAAKNYRHVIVLTDPSQYDDVFRAWQEGRLDERARLKLALKAFRHTAHYDAVIASFLEGWVDDASFPGQLTLAFDLEKELRYGENPHQQAAVYRDALPRTRGLVAARQLQGKELSYNNLSDAQAAWDIVREFDRPAAVAVKHANPCGVAVGSDLEEAFDRAYQADPVSIFGGIVALNRPLDGPTATRMSEIFLELIVAPAFHDEACEILARKKNLRLLQAGEGALDEATKPWQLRRLDDGLLVQTADRTGEAGYDEWQIAGRHRPSLEDRKQLEFAWRVVKHVKSNAIVVANQEMTLGIGAGQMNRIDAARIALRQAESSPHGAGGAYLASDAFFPFKDTVEEAARYGIRGIIQPGGSIRDQESIEAADAAGIVMLFTGMRHFLH